MKPKILALLFATILSDSWGQVSSATENVRLEGLWDGNPEPIVSYDVTVDRMKNQQTWDPFIEAAPLQLHEAVKIGRDWMLKQPDGAPDITVEYVRLKRCPKPFRDRWFYRITFAFERSGYTKTCFTIVLLDGTVVEPKPHGPPP